MTTISCAHGPIEFGTGHPTLLINAHLRVYDDLGLNQEVFDCLFRHDFQLFVQRAQQSVELWDCKLVDICLDAHGLDEIALLPEIALAIHEATGQAISLDTRNAEAIRRTLAVYPHKAIINSIPGEEIHIRSLMPLVAEFKTAVVLMLTDEAMIPETVDERLRIAEKLIRVAESYGIPIEDIIIDPVCMPSSAIKDAMQVDLGTLKAVKREFGCSTVLGVTNAGFGMPVPGTIVQAYIMAAIAAGLDVVLAVTESPIIPMLLPSVLAMDFLSGVDPEGGNYIGAFRKHPERFVLPSTGDREKDTGVKQGRESGRRPRPINRV